MIEVEQLTKRYPGRTRVVHLKPTVVKDEAGKKAIFGQDSVPWGPIIKASGFKPQP